MVGQIIKLSDFIRKLYQNTCIACITLAAKYETSAFLLGAKMNIRRLKTTGYFLGFMEYLLKNIASNSFHALGNEGNELIILEISLENC